MLLGARWFVAGPNFGRKAVDERPVLVGAEHLRCFAKLLKTTELRLGAIAQGLQRFDVSYDPLGSDASSWGLC